MLINLALKDAFLDKVAKLNRRAKKMNLGPVLFEFGGVVERAASEHTAAAFLRDKKWYATYIEVTILNEAPVMNGYKFLAVVDLTGTKPMVRRQPWASTTDLSKYFSTDGHCDHCNTSRVRNDVLIVENAETGDLMQIGRNCAADFFRSSDATGILSVNDYEGALSVNDCDDWGSSKHFTPIVSLERLFETAAAVVRTFGWVDTKMAMRDDTLFPTRGRVMNNLFPSPKMAAEEFATITDADRAVACDVLAWLDVEWLDITAKTEFQRNVQAAVETDGSVRYVRAKNLGYLIWMINGYAVAYEKKVLAAREKAGAAASNFVGSPGVREEFGVTLKFRRVFASEFGPKALCKFVDDAGNTIIWWSTSDTGMQMVLDNHYVVKATVKAHAVFEGSNQTEVSRLAIIEGVLNNG